jgi:predicted transcriptional regulator
VTVARITGADASCMKTVADVMVRHPKLCHENSTAGDVRQLFGDDHVHAVLIMSGTRLLTVIYRTDLDPEAADSAPAARLGRLSGRLITPTAPADTALRLMIADGRRRLAVVGPDGTLLGLLCLKRSGTGFCSDENVRQRQREHPPAAGHRTGGPARARSASEMAGAR